jgi:hypothetical protein
MSSNKNDWPCGIAGCERLRARILSSAIPLRIRTRQVGAGLFGMNMGIMAPIMTLVLHLIFGAVLGWVYGLLVAWRDVSNSQARA